MQKTNGKSPICCVTSRTLTLHLISRVLEYVGKVVYNSFTLLLDCKAIEEKINEQKI